MARPRNDDVKPKKISNTLKAARQAAGMTQEALEAASGITQQHISGIECGRQEPSIAVLRKLADALKISPGALLDGVTEGGAK